MKHRLRILGVLAALSLVVVVLALRPLKSRPDIGLEHFERMRPGLTRAEVEHLLGGPPRNALRYRGLVWLPQATGRPISAEIAPGSPAVDLFVREDRPKGARQPAEPASLDFFPQETGKDGHQAVWITRATLMAVYFGSDGRLRHTYSSTVHESVPPSVIDWLASRPRMIRRSLGF
jgi:hypothetical protein